MPHQSTISTIVRAFVISTAILSISLYKALTLWLDEDTSIWRVISYSSTISSVLIFALLSETVTDRLRYWLGHYVRSIHPSLSGQWSGEISPEKSPISPQTNLKTTLPFTAIIRQSLFFTQIDFFGETFHSITISATPTTREGQHWLTYVYEVDPKNASHHKYEGTARLRLFWKEENGIEELHLEGKFYTSRRTIGEISMKRQKRP